MSRLGEMWRGFEPPTPTPCGFPLGQNGDIICIGGVYMFFSLAPASER